MSQESPNCERGPRQESKLGSRGHNAMCESIEDETCPRSYTHVVPRRRECDPEFANSGQCRLLWTTSAALLKCFGGESTRTGVTWKMTGVDVRG